MPAPRSLRLSEIASLLNGELVGDPDVLISSVASLETAGPGDIAFLTKGRYRRLLGATRAAAVILPREERDATSLPRILCEDPYACFARVSNLFYADEVPPPGIHPYAAVDPGAQVAASASVGPGCHVGAGAVIGEQVALGASCSVGRNVRIGEGSRLYPSVVVYDDCVVGSRVRIHSCAVIGSDGFGIAMHEGRWMKIRQAGRVVIGDDVEIGAGTTIDRGALDDTVIEEGVKLDNQIQVGHNVRIGAHTAMAGCVGIAGSARIGRYCTVGGGAIILGHLEIADHVHVSAGTLITKSISAPGTYGGAYPFQVQREWGKTAVLLRNITKLEARIRELERRMMKSERGT